MLAILLLHANEVVSTSRLVDELWRDEPPDDAATALHQHVSRLRRLLEPHEPIATRPPGYVLRLEPGQLDLHRFEELSAQGRERFEAGDAVAAAGLLREALALWRGRPLADLEEEPFVREATGHLEDAWLATVEARVEADLALGREAVLVPELRELIRRHPLRERVRGQLMLALYRSGRQAEALEAYTDARRTLVEQVGLEPGPELQRLQARILAQDPELQRTHEVSGGRRRLPPRLLAALGAIALAVAALLAVTRSGDDQGAETVSGSLIALVDPRSGKVEHRIGVGSTPSALAVGEGGVWVVDADDRTVSRIDPRTRDVTTFGTGSTPTDVAAGEGGIWVGDGEQLAGVQFVGPVATGLTRLDPSTRTVRARVGLPAEGSAVSNLVEDHLAVAGGGVWAITPESALVRIDGGSNAIVRTLRPFRAAAVAADGGSVWLLGVDGTIARIDARTGAVGGSTKIATDGPGSLAVGAGSAWVMSPSDGTLWRVASGAHLSPTAIPVGEGVTDVAFGEGSVWLVNPLRGELSRVDPATNAVTQRIALGGVPRAVAAGLGGIWVAVEQADAPAGGGGSAGVQALPSMRCGPLFAGAGKGDRRVLIASDLPLQGGTRAPPQQMAQAIAFVLRAHAFRAGPFEVVYQSCDDSIARTGLFDHSRCAANARSYAHNDDVVGVIGPFNSDCAVDEIPLLNSAPGGPLALVAPFTSYVGLTRAGPGTPPGGLNVLYPTGRRSFVRVFPTDDLQAAALAQVVKSLGRRRVYVLHDGEPGYGRLLATSFDRAARRSGLVVAGTATWDPQSTSYAPLAAAVARSRPDAVFLGGLIDNNVGEVVRDLRARLGRKVTLVGPDGLTPISLLFERAGPAARGVYVSLNGVTAERFGPAARRFEREFGATQPGVPVQPAAVYAAQAAEVLLDAIARSDGTRASVIRRLFATRLRGGLLGDVSFDRNGDMIGSPVTIVRATRPGGATTILSVEGAVVDRVVRPPLALVR